jgi:hypothetical protein
VSQSVPCPEFLHSGKAFNATCTLTKKLELLSHRVNALLEYGDPAHFQELLILREDLKKSHAGYDALLTQDPLLYEGREILFNRASGLHTDSHDPPLSWAILVALGSHEDGFIDIPHLGLKARLNPRDAVMIRGRVLPHQVTNWKGGQRICIPHFTHSTTWRSAGRLSVFLD